MREEKFDENINASDKNNDADDFPKEIVQLLMKNHPIKNPEMNEEEKSKDSRINREEARLARKKRLEEAQEELDSLDKKDASRKKSEESKHIEKTKHIENTKHIEEPTKQDDEEYNCDIATLFEDDDDMVQLVRRTNHASHTNHANNTNHQSHKKGFLSSDLGEIEEIEKTLKAEKTPRPEGKKASKKQHKKVFEERDDEYYNIKKPEDAHRVLDDFFSDNEDYEEDEGRINSKTIFFAGVAVIAILILFLGYKTISLTGKLNEANKNLATLEEVQSKNEELKLTVLSLEEQVSGNNTKPADGASATDNVGTTDQASPTTPPSPTADNKPVASGNFDMYTIVDGDSMWSIAQKTLGNGALYQKILDANGLKESDPIKAGQTLKIPK